MSGAYEKISHFIGRTRSHVLRAWVAALLGICVVFSIGGHAYAAIRIGDDLGGSMHRYESHYIAIRNSGERVVIDGVCVSACTMLLGIVPPERVCVTSRAMLGFHAARVRFAGNFVVSDAGTAELMRYYPAPVRNWIARNGGLSEDMIFLWGGELNRILPRCR